jgi:hypothetical protein
MKPRPSNRKTKGARKVGVLVMKKTVGGKEARKGNGVGTSPIGDDIEDRGCYFIASAMVFNSVSLRSFQDPELPSQCLS